MPSRHMTLAKLCIGHNPGHLIIVGLNASKVARAHYPFPRAPDRAKASEVTMEAREASGPLEVANSRRHPSRRLVLGFAGALGAAMPLATIGAARAFTVLRTDWFSDSLDGLPLCRAVMAE